MIPIINIFGKEISSYMLAALVGILAVLLMTYKTSRKQGLNEVEMTFIMLFAAAGMLVGSHILYALTQFKALIFLIKNLFSFKDFETFVSVLNFVFGGSVFYGGLLGAIAVCVFYIKKKKLDKRYLDIAACSFPLFHAFGRIGCFLSGCCYGIESDFGFVYENALLQEINGVRRFPVQLVEAAFNFILFAVLFYFVLKGKHTGKILTIYLLSYAPARFILEFFRGDEIRGHIGPLSTSQIISVLIIVTVIFTLSIKKIRKRKQKANV